MTTTIERLRERHRPEPKCVRCLDVWPCDTVAALDALEEQLQDLLVIRPSRGQLQARLNAATELIRQAMKERHTKGRHSWDDDDGTHTLLLCGSKLGTPIDTCENCAPYRAWLAGKEGEGNV